MNKNNRNIHYLFAVTYLAFMKLSYSGEITDCEFVEFDIYHVRLSCGVFNGTHEPLQCFHAYFKNKYLKDKVKTLETGDCRGNRLNSSISTVFRSLRTYDLFYHGVEHLSPADLNFKNLQRLNASHNELVKISRSTFSNTPNLNNIDFSFNKITILEKDAFSTLDELKMLNLKFNFIETVDENMFEHNNKLKELNLDENPLKRFDGNIFRPFSISASVHVCSEQLQELDTSYLNESIIIDFQKRMVSFSTSTNNSQLTIPEETFKNLTYFNISGNQLQNTSKFVELLGPSIKVLDLSSNFLGESKSKTFQFLQIFQYYGNLSHLGLSNMNLTDVGFNFTKSKLKVLDLSRNLLTTLNFTGTFEDLIILDVSHNDLDDIQPSVLNSIPTVIEINLSYNKISSMATYAFADLKDLEILDLSNNLIQSIEGDSFGSNKKLKKLRLENNLITRIDCKIFDFLQNSFERIEKHQNQEGEHENVVEIWKNVNEVDLSCIDHTLEFDVDDVNGVIFRRDEQFHFRCSRETLQNLKYLNISGLHLQSIPKLLPFLGSSLEILDVTSNCIGQLDVHTFEKLTNLQVLQLSRTNLSNFGFETFYHHRKLHTLDLSYNQLKKLNFTLLFRNFKNLNTLNLEGNYLTEIDTVTKSIFPKLTSLAISKNLFSCDYLAGFLFEWHNLHLISNPSNQTNIDGVDCYHHKGHGVDSRNGITTSEPVITQTQTTMNDIELTSEWTSPEFESTQENEKNQMNTSTELHNKTDIISNETNHDETYHRSPDLPQLYLLELRIFECALALCILCAILTIVKLKCMKVKGKLQCNARVKNRCNERNGQHGIELIEHEILSD